MKNNLMEANAKQIEIMTDAMMKCKERFDKAVQEGNSDRTYDAVSQINQLSHSITEAVKAGLSQHLEEKVNECLEALDEIDNAIAAVMFDEMEA